MKLWETYRFEVVYQSRRVSTWFYFVLLLGISFLMARDVFVAGALEGSYFINAPFAVAQVTLVACLLSLLSLAAGAGAVGGGGAGRLLNSATRDTPDANMGTSRPAPVSERACLTTICPLLQ